MLKNKKHYKERKNPEQTQSNKYNSRKLFLTLLILTLGFIPMILKFHDSMFLQLFKEWSWLAMGSFAIYTGGNIGQKFSRRKSHYDQDPEYQDPHTLDVNDIKDQEGI